MVHAFAALCALPLIAGAAFCTAPPPTGAAPWSPAPADSAFANVRDFGAVGDGVADDTSAFRAAAATGKQLFVPKPAVVYKLTRYIQLRNSIYGDGSMPVLRMTGATGEREQAMLKISGYRGPSPLVIQGLVLDGQWSGPKPPKEWSANIDVSDSSHIVIQFNGLLNAAGDNVQIGDAVPGLVQDIVVRSNRMENPYRCNVSLEWADGAVLDGNLFSKVTRYVTAVDVEPNSGTRQFVSNLQVTQNSYDTPEVTGVSLVNGSGVTGTNIIVTGNSGRVRRPFSQQGQWSSVVVKDNTWAQ